MCYLNIVKNNHGPKQLPNENLSELEGRGLYEGQKCIKISKDDKQATLYRLKKLYLGYYMYMHAHMCMQ